MRVRIASFGLASALVLGLAGGAHGTTLADLNGGGSLTVGSLTFSDFTISVTPGIDQKLSDYNVLSLSDGFRIQGPIGVSSGGQGDLLVSYQVSAAQGSTVDGISLKFNGKVGGAGSQASVSEDLSPSPSEAAFASLNVIRLGDGSLAKAFDSASFAPQTSFTVDKDILVIAGSGGSSGGQDRGDDKGDKDRDKGDKDRDKGDKDGDKDGGHHHHGDLDLASGGGGFANISWVDQRFAVVPEPGPLALLGSGLMGLLVFGRKGKS